MSKEEPFEDITEQKYNNKECQRGSNLLLEYFIGWFAFLLCLGMVAFATYMVILETGASLCILKEKRRKGITREEGEEGEERGERGRIGEEREEKEEIRERREIEERREEEKREEDNMTNKKIFIVHFV